MGPSVLIRGNWYKCIGPANIESAGQFVLACRGGEPLTDRIVTYTSPDGTDDWRQLVFNEVTDVAPSLCRWNEKLYMAWARGRPINSSIFTAELRVPAK